MLYRNAVPVVLLLLLGLCATACSSGTPSAGSASTAQSTTTTTTAAQVIASPTVTINGQTVKVPTEDGTTPIKSDGDTGQQIILTTTGVLPRSLYATLNQPVTWTNLTTKPVTLTFKGTPTHMTTVVQPGSSYSWNPVDQLSFSYTSSAGGAGLVYSGIFSN
jgi:hypothetical protein